MRAQQHNVMASEFFCLLKLFHVEHDRAGLADPDSF